MTTNVMKLISNLSLHRDRSTYMYLTYFAHYFRLKTDTKFRNDSKVNETEWLIRTFVSLKCLNDLEQCFFRVFLLTLKRLNLSQNLIL